MLRRRDPGCSLTSNFLNDALTGNLLQRNFLTCACLVSAYLQLRQRGKLGDNVYGCAISFQASSLVRFNGQKVRPDAIMCGRGNQIDVVTPASRWLMRCWSIVVFSIR